MTRRAAVYSRISSDPTGRALGVERQQAECAELVARRGWHLTVSLQDNDISAYSGKTRPAYARLLQLVEDDAIDVIVAWHPDRLHRSPAELEEFIGTLERHHVEVETVRAGSWDLSTPSGRLVARQLGGVARYESEQKADRVRTALSHRAKSGATHGRASYGWRRHVDPATGHKRDILDPAEAAVVQRIARDLLAGESLRSITAALNAESTPTPLATARDAAPGREDDQRRPATRVWRKGMTRALVVRPRNAGIRVHQGQVVGEGDWEPILDRGTWDMVVALLADPSRKTSTGTAAAHLLSGIARCGVCGGPIRATMNRTVPSYACHERRCVSRNRRDVDDLITQVVLARLGRDDARSLLAVQGRDETDAARQEVAELQARLDIAADQYADGAIDARQHLRIVERLRPRIAAARARSRPIDDGNILSDLVDAADIRARWDSLSLPRRRAVVQALITVEVLRAQPGARRFDPNSIRVTWRS